MFNAIFRYYTVKEFKKLLRYIKTMYHPDNIVVADLRKMENTRSCQVFYRDRNGKTQAANDLQNKVYILETETSIKIYGRLPFTDKKGVRSMKAQQIHFNKKDGEPERKITGAIAFRTLRRMMGGAPLHKVKKTAKTIPLLWFNPALEGIRHDGVWAYDMRLAYGWGLLQDIPDTENMKEHDWKKPVPKGMIGFAVAPDLEGNRIIDVFFGGEKGAMMVCPQLPSPFTKFVYHYWEKIKKAKTKADRLQPKQMVIFAVGYMHRHNMYIGASIIEHTKRKILQYKNEKTLMINTDCIFQLGEIPGIDHGEEIGQFRIDGEDKKNAGRANQQFAYKGHNYQWNLETPTYRGVVKGSFPPGWDILKDPIPPAKIEYILSENLELVEVEI